MTENLRERVVRWLRAEIISGQMPAKSMISVPGLATSLNISTTPVREALLELSRAGLLRPHRNRGFEVLEPSPDEISQIFEMRVLLEVESAGLAMDRGPIDTVKLRELAGMIEVSAKSNDYRTYIEADREFHRQIAVGSNNFMLLNYITDLKDRMRLYGLTSPEGQRQQILSISEHYEIVDLIESGRPEELKELLARHIKVWKPIYIAHIRTAHREAVNF